MTVSSAAKAPASSTNHAVRPSRRPVAHRLDIVPVGIEHERGIVAGAYIAAAGPARRCPCRRPQARLLWNASTVPRSFAVIATCTGLPTPPSPPIQKSGLPPIPKPAAGAFRSLTGDLHHQDVAERRQRPRVERLRRPRSRTPGTRRDRSWWRFPPNGRSLIEALRQPSLFSSSRRRSLRMATRDDLVKRMMTGKSLRSCGCHRPNAAAPGAGAGGT